MLLVIQCHNCVGITGVFLCCPGLALLLSGSVCLGIGSIFSHILALPPMAAKLCLVSLVGPEWDTVS